MADSFSIRNGYLSVETPVLIREDAPEELRYFIIAFAKSSGLSYHAIRKIICDCLLKRPDENNWSDGNVESECIGLMDSCSWHHVYDIAEAVNDVVVQRASYYGNNPADSFSQKFNDFCIKKGIGWHFQNNKIVARSEDTLDVLIEERLQELKDSEKTVHNELQEAWLDISKRPKADITGAIQHAGTALECYARKITNNPKSTLGDIVKKNPSYFPEPIKTIAEKVWGFASEKGRHVNVNNEPDFAEACLIVGLVASLIGFLHEKELIKQPNNTYEWEDDFPF